MFNPRKQQPNIHNSLEPLNFDFQTLGNQFRAQKIEEHEDDAGGAESGASSPTLWQNSPSRSLDHVHYRSLSPSSRTKAIARGQWELMEMVKNMPESCFELSLKDLVEQPKSFESQDEGLSNKKEKNQVVKMKNNDQIRKAKMMMMRSKSVENNGGVFIKMVFPVSLKSSLSSSSSSSSSKKKKNSLANTTRRVSPKPEEIKKEWWKKTFTGSTSDSSTGRNGSRGSYSSSNSSSRNSKSNRNRKREGILSSCWSSLCFSNNIN